MLRIHRSPLALFAVMGVLLADRPAVAADGKVSGTITVQGKPLAAGRILFHLGDGQFVGAKVKDGRYSVARVPSGTHKITVEGAGVPAKYTNDDTTPLQAEVKAGDVAFDADLDT